MISRIAFFDFDGTITRKDTLLEFIKHSCGKWRFYLGFVINAPVLLAYKVKIISNQRAKEIVLRYFFGGMENEKFAAHCDDFSKNVIPGLIRPKARREIDKLKSVNAKVVVVSASPQDWLLPWCRAEQLDCLATQLQLVDGRITGKLQGRNCHGEEKVSRIRTAFDLPHYSEIYCYGDTRGDLPMLALGNYRFYQPFR